MDPAILAGRMAKARAAAEAAGADVLLTADPASVAWLADYESPLLPDPWSLPPLVLIDDSERPALILPDHLGAGLADTPCVLRTYPGYALRLPDPAEDVTALVRQLVRGRRVATDARTLPALLAAAVDWRDAGAALVRARAVKDSADLARIRAACHLCDVAQSAARSAAHAGASELEILDALRSAIDRDAGHPVAVVADVVGGIRSEHVGGPASAQRLAEGDALIVDVVAPCVRYWGDSCSTILIGESRAIRDAHARACEALERGVAAVRAGVVASDLDALLRTDLAYPHHSGHGIGTSGFEEPYVLPGSTTELEPGMVIALEPGFYGPGYGARVEQVVVVEEDGCEVISQHDLSLAPGSLGAL